LAFVIKSGNKSARKIVLNEEQATRRPATDAGLPAGECLPIALRYDQPLPALVSPPEYTSASAVERWIAKSCVALWRPDKTYTPHKDNLSIAMLRKWLDEHPNQDLPPEVSSCSLSNTAEALVDILEARVGLDLRELRCPGTIASLARGFVDIVNGANPRDARV
jgi:hypothetical protein